MAAYVVVAAAVVAGSDAAAPAPAGAPEGLSIATSCGALSNFFAAN